MKTPYAIIIMDGYGINEDHNGNAVYADGSKNITAMEKIYPTSRLGASGMSVGLPDGQMGNSEVGHLNIGAGRIVYQDLTKITKDIRDGALGIGIVIAMYFSVAWGLSVSVIKTIMLFS